MFKKHLIVFIFIKIIIGMFDKYLKPLFVMVFADSFFYIKVMNSLKGGRVCSNFIILYKL
jgi:hypothetical protein